MEPTLAGLEIIFETSLYFKTFVRAYFVYEGELKPDLRSNEILIQGSHVFPNCKLTSFTKSHRNIDQLPSIRGHKRVVPYSSLCCKNEI